MIDRRALQTKVFAALVLVGAACVAALVSHVAIDLAGDVVLARDTYDGLDHRSRGEVVLIALTLLTAAVLRIVWLAFEDARTGRVLARSCFEDVFGRSRWRFIGAVVALALPALMAMELFDTFADGSRVDELTDLLGGSAWLGLGITLPTAAIVAQAVRSVAKLVMRSHHVLVAVIGRILALLIALRPRTIASCVRPDTSRLFRRCSILARRSGKRGPPLPAS